MISARSASAAEEGSARAIARWENEGGATLALPDWLSTRIRQDLFERETVQAAYTAGPDAEGALRSIHSYPRPIRSHGPVRPTLAG
jgi:hypothetical protein